MEGSRYSLKDIYTQNVLSWHIFWEIPKFDVYQGNSNTVWSIYHKETIKTGKLTQEDTRNYGFNNTKISRLNKNNSKNQLCFVIWSL